jgi:hypothetical protein
MTSTAIRRVPWTCRWGRFGVAVEHTASFPRVDDVFWTCHQPADALRLTKRGECDRCPQWEPQRTVDSNLN